MKQAVRRPRRGKPSGKRRARTAPKRRSRVWVRWPNERLLDMRICDLDIGLERTWLEKCMKTLHEDLEERGILLKPYMWISREWFTPDTATGFAVPFYLAHPRLMRLERNQMLEVEGGTWDECLRIMRHETGHAIQHGYALHRLGRWRTHFGKSSQKYPDYYRPNPASRRYVQHLRLYYAQSHPAEDFAETFAVWLQPRSNWRKRYAGWPALRKLEYVDELMQSLRGVRPKAGTRRRDGALRTVRTTLREYYEEKRGHYNINYPDIYDRDLRRVFSDELKHVRSERASTFLRRNRGEIRRLVSKWTGEYQFTLDQVLSDMIGRCRELRLRAVGSQRRLLMDFAMLLTVKTMHFLYTRRSWIAL